MKINTISELKSSIKELHKVGPQVVAISSIEINSDKLTSVISTKKGN